MGLVLSASADIKQIIKSMVYGTWAKGNQSPESGNSQTYVSLAGSAKIRFLIVRWLLRSREDVVPLIPAGQFLIDSK
jgi:hypothetical protein